MLSRAPNHVSQWIDVRVYEVEVAGHTAIDGIRRRSTELRCGHQRVLRIPIADRATKRVARPVFVHGVHAEILICSLCLHVARQCTWVIHKRKYGKPVAIS